MRSNLIITIVITFILFYSCQPEKSSKNSKISAAVIAVLNTQVDAWNAGDIDGFMAGYWRSDSLRFASGGNITYGWQATLQRYKKAYPDKSTMGQLDFSVIKVTPLGTDAAIVFGRWRLTRENDSPHGLFTLTFRKMADGWFIIQDHTSSATPN